MFYAKSEFLQNKAKKKKKKKNPLILPVLSQSGSCCTLVVMVILSDMLHVDVLKVKVAERSGETRRAGMKGLTQCVPLQGIQKLGISKVFSCVLGLKADIHIQYVYQALPCCFFLSVSLPFILTSLSHGLKCDCISGLHL